MSAENAVLEVVLAWLREGRRVIAADLVTTAGSAPLAPGATMFIDEVGNVEGSVTGGCVEGALVEEAQRILAGGRPRLCSYGYSDELAGTVGLSCGGSVEVFVHEIAGKGCQALELALGAALNHRPAALATVIRGPGTGSMLAVASERIVGSLGRGDALNRVVRREAEALMEHGTSLVRAYPRNGTGTGAGIRVHLRTYGTRPKLVIFGAIEFAAALAALARELSYQVTICDARPPFARSARLHRVAEVVVGWPDGCLEGMALGERDAIVVMTHDPKFDEPALIAALRSGAGYVGALGSRRTHAERRRRLAERGLPDRQLNRIASPCGLDIGAVTPAETAVSILAEVIAARTGREGGRLVHGSGSIHGAPPPEHPALLRGMPAPGVSTPG